MANKNEVGRTLAKDLMHHHPGSGGGLNTHHHHHLSLLPNFLDTAGASASTAAKEDMSSPTTDTSIGDVQQQLGPSKLQPPSGAADLLRALSRYTTDFPSFLGNTTRSSDNFNATSSILSGKSKLSMASCYIVMQAFFQHNRKN